MNSTERKEKRYQRRKAAREAKRLRLLETYNFERVISPDALWKAAKAARRGVYWKTSVQRYNMNLLRNVFRVHKELKAGADPRKGFICFDVMERGKLRHIQSVHYSERVVQKSLCTNALLPLITRNLIYDNGASLKNKGIDFALKRLKHHLREHYKLYGNSGYILQIDFKGYFNSIMHEPLYELYRKAFGEDTELVTLASLFVAAFGERGLGLGSETSQINAISYPNAIDHFIKEVMKCKNYARYNDDSYFLFPTKAHAKTALEALEKRYAALGITLSPNKTNIIKLSKGFIFLKTFFQINANGHISACACRESITRQRQKLKKFYKFLMAGKMTIGHIHNSYMSWRGYIQHKNARDTIRSMDALYYKLFCYWPKTKKQKKRSYELWKKNRH